MRIAKADLNPLSARMIPVALTGMLICGSWGVAQDPFGDPAQPARAAPASRVAVAKQPARPTGRAVATKQAIPSLEDLLARTLTGHPQIVAARSKVQLAEAELKLTRFEVAREQIELWNTWSYARQVSDRTSAAYEQGAGPAGPAIEAQSKLALVEAELRQVLADSAEDPGGKLSPVSRSAVRRVPTGPIAEQTREVLAMPVEIDFIDEPLKSVIDYFKDVFESEMIVDNACREIAISATFRAPRFVAGIQAIEDLYPEVRFVVREYGIFVTTKGSPADLESISAIDFWFETAGESERELPGPVE